MQDIPKKTQDGLDLLKHIRGAFDQFEIVDLPRPGAAASRSFEISWALSVYVHSAILHTASLLTSFLDLARSRSWPAATIVSRSIYELAAQTHYMEKYVSGWKERNQLDSIWDLLTRINVGSSWIQGVIATRRPQPDDFDREEEDFPTPHPIGKIMACFAREIEGQRLANYRFLSEFTHRNMAAFSQHYVFEQGTVKFRREPSAEDFPTVVTLVLVAAQTLIDRLNKLNKLVDRLSGLGGDAPLRESSPL